MMGDIAAAGGEATGVEPALARALADEMVSLTGLLSDLAYELGSDADTLRRHMESLQAVDRITQIQLALAEVLRADGPAEARLGDVTLEDLAASLKDGHAAHRAGTTARAPD